MKTTIEMNFKKSTKNTHLYTTDCEGVACTAVYVQKSAFKGEAPKAITVTVEA